MLLKDAARTIRSKNAGSFVITVEVIFDNRAVYECIKKNGYITRDSIAKAYAVENDAIMDFVYYDAGLAIKANFKRDLPSGGPGETDVYGCQQYAPLLLLEIPDIVRQCM